MIWYNIVWKVVLIMSYSNEIKSNIIATLDELDKKPLVCVLKTFAVDNTIVTTSSKFARFIVENFKEAESTIKSGIKKKTHIYEVCFSSFDCDVDVTDGDIITAMFLMFGSISNPQNSYNIEFTFHEEELADYLLDKFASLEITFNKTVRNNKYVIYSKSSATLLDFLYYIGQNKKAQEIEDMRILRSIKSRVSRRINFDMHNDERKYSAAKKYIDMIDVISKTIGLSNIDRSLAEIAMLRIDYPDKSLSELGKLCTTPLTKSGVNSRLKRIEKLYHSLEGK